MPGVGGASPGAEQHSCAEQTDADADHRHPAQTLAEKERAEQGDEERHGGHQQRNRSRWDELLAVGDSAIAAEQQQCAGDGGSAPLAAADRIPLAAAAQPTGDDQEDRAGNDEANACHQ